MGKAHMNSDGFLNAEEVARYLGIGKNAVYQLAKSGAISSYRIGRKLRFTREDADAYLAAAHRGTPPSRTEASATINPEMVPANADGHALAQAAAFGVIPGAPFTIAGNDAAAGMLAHALNEAGIAAEQKPCESYTALVDLYAGETAAATVHLFDQASNSCTIPYVQRLVPGVSVVVFRLYGRSQGLIVRRGNPKKIATWGALLRSDVRLANRAKGSGARIMLDEKLRALEARCETIAGYEDATPHGTGALIHVARGLADVTVGTALEARGIEGVQFVPLQAEWVDLAVRKTPAAQPVIRKLKDLFESERLRRDFAALETADLSKLGCIIFEN